MSVWDANDGFGTTWNKQKPSKWARGDWGTRFAEQNPTAVWDRRLTNKGLPTTSSNPFGQFLRDQQAEAMRGFQQTLLNRPKASFNKYTGKLGSAQDWRDRFQMLAPSQQGIVPGSGGEGPMRWVSY